MLSSNPATVSTTQFVNQLLNEAIIKQASDIHIEPFTNHWRIRMRIDGLLHLIQHMDNTLAQRVISHFKIMANLNIAEQRLPQDGNVRHPYSDIDIRINTAPTLYGEKAVLRIHYTNHNQITLANLGFTHEQQIVFNNYLQEPSGLILVTGPTGSGKTSTLYAALAKLNKQEKNIVTIEDPVEIKIEGINQTNINLAIGLDFTSQLRANLRQDPDIIMIGEIRDRETAIIAMQAALTGHLVLATLHAHSSYAAFSRLYALGVSWHDLTQSIIMMINQRLIKLLCTQCKKQHQHIKQFYEAGTCSACQLGYKGRMGIFELLPFTRRLQHRLLTCTTLSDLKQYLANIDRLTLYQDAMLKIKSGHTTLSEVERVLGKLN